MKKYYAFLTFLAFSAAFAIYSCSDSESAAYVPVAPHTSVNVDLSQVPYEKLSDYHFFDGPLKDQKPADGVLLFEPASTLFTDYALKKRFVWMPKGTKATFSADSKVLELPVGAVLIKSFYYDHVQNTTPVDGTRIIETRLMIRKASGWIFANYVWNDAQTEAYQDLAGSHTQVEWKENGITPKSANYRIPSEEQCIICHKKQIIENDVITSVIHTPIGIKPQNMNFALDYGSETKNQLTKWVEAGYLEAGFSMPSAEHTTVDYRDQTKSLDLRARSYVDANCAHCHNVENHCYYRPMRFPFAETANRTNMGVCVDTEEMQGFAPALGKIVTPGTVGRSMLFHRINTVNPAFRMPLHGRTIIHDEGVALMEQWINSLAPCPD